MHDQDLGQINQIENQLRENNEYTKFTQQDIVAQLASLKDQVQLGDRSRAELRDKLRITEENNREMFNFVKGF